MSASAVDAVAMEFLKDSTITPGKLHEAAHIAWLARNFAGGKWFDEMSQEIIVGVRRAPKHSMGVAFSELENVISQVMALLEMQGRQLAEYREKDWRDKERGSFAAGHAGLGLDMANELRRAYDAAWDELRK